MNRNLKYFLIFFILCTVPLASAVLSTFQHNAIKIGDNKDTDLAGTSIRNGTINVSIVGNIIYANSYNNLQDAINASCNCNPMDSTFGDKAIYPVFIPNGTYAYTKQLYIPAYSHIWGIKGSTILKPVGNIAAIKNENWDTTSAGMGYDTGIVIHDITIDGSLQTGETGGGISLKSAPRSNIYNTEIFNVTGYAGIYLTGYRGSGVPDMAHIIVENNFIHNISNGGGVTGHGIYITAPHNVSGIIQKNTINLTQGSGILIEDFANLTNIKDNFLFNIGGTGINANTVSYVVVTDNYVYNSTRCISGNFNYGKITNNICLKSYNDDIQRGGGIDPAIISNNILESINSYGIRLTGSKNTSVYGNHLRLQTIAVSIEGEAINNNSVYNNFGASPFNFGASANTLTSTNITAFGTGDTWFNTTRGLQCVSLGAGKLLWKPIGNSIGGC